ncbi:putative molybdenum carrier protein, partial [Acinetobacter baumannii]
AILKYERPWVDVNLAHATDYTARSIAGWLVDHEVGVLNVAGNRERTKPGLGAEAEAFLAKVFHIVKLKESGHECKDT